MSSRKQLRTNIARLRQARHTLEDSLKRATEAAGAKNSGGRNINVATRVNKAVATNFGESDTIRGASSTQSVKITQDPGGTEEVSESTNVQISSGGHT